jgi:O-antigen/teichoic acid export membrane protein
MFNTKSSAVSLKRRVLDAGFWSLFGFALSYPIRLGSSLLMTRLLVPEMFGVMAIATMVMTGLVMFSDVGLRPNIIHSARGNDPAFLNTAWVIQIIRGMLLWVLALCISLLISTASHLGLVPKGSAYADPYLPYVIAVVSISAVIGGFQSTKISEARRGLLLARVTQIQVLAQGTGLVCMIGWALMDRSIWALVAGGICSSVTTTVLSHLWLSGVPNRWHWETSAFFEIFHFGKWMLLSSILGFFANNADRMLLAGFVDSAMLGIYSIAFTICSLVTQVMNRIFSDVSFSAFSEVARDRSPELKRTLYRFHVVTASFGYFCAGALISSGDALIRLLYDPRYVRAGWMLEVLAVGLLAVPFNLAQFALLARGLPKIFTNLVAIHGPVAIVFVSLGFHFFGLPGALWGIVASQLSSVPVTIYYQLKYDLFELWTELFVLTTFFAGVIFGRVSNLLL